MNTETRTVARQSRGGLLARLRARLRGDSERGDVMIEVLIFMAVIAMTTAAYATTAHAANKVSRVTTATDIVSQQAHGVLEQAQAQPWAILGFKPSQEGFQNRFSNLPTVQYPGQTTEEATVSLQPTTDVEIRGVVMTQRVDVTWSDNRAENSPPNSFGTKVITVSINYLVPGETIEKVKVFSTTRTSSPAEALPPFLSGLAEAGQGA